jgi:hypothetical protein
MGINFWILEKILKKLTIINKVNDWLIYQNEKRFYEWYLNIITSNMKK